MSTSWAIALSTPAAASEADEAAVKTVVDAVAAYADRGDFISLERLYAEEIRVDYSSLTGAAAEVRSASALLTDWARLLPGFDATRHDLSAVRATIDGVRATATAKVAAHHWLGDAVWRVDGRYRYELERSETGWRITAMTFALERETGDRAILERAAENAKRAPADYVLRQQTRAAILQFLTGLEEKDMEKVNGVWADDAIQDMPYVPSGFPRRLVGKDALVRQYAAWPAVSGKARLTDDLVFHPMADPRAMYVEYRGITEIKTTGRLYDQRYGGFFYVDGGKITLFREYFDPRVFADAFGLPQ